MEPEIEFSPAAFKHGVSEADIWKAVAGAAYEGPADDNDINKRLLLGFDTSANMLEIMFNYIDDETINVFHAMKCRNIYYPLLNE